MQKLKFNQVGIIKYERNTVPIIYVDDTEDIPPPDCNGIDVNSNIYFSPELKKCFVKFYLDSDKFNIHKEVMVNATDNMEFFDLLSKIWCFGLAKQEEIYLIQIPKINNLLVIYEKLRKFKETGLVPYD